MRQMKRNFDVGRAKLLVDEISANLATLPADAARYSQLRAEVDALRAMLDRPDAAPELVEGRMKSVHGLFDRAAAELRADGVRAGMFLEDIGRMLGLD
jgi:anti-sigma factor RsiW